MKVVSMAAAMLAVCAMPAGALPAASMASVTVPGAYGSAVARSPASLSDPIKKCMPHCSGGQALSQALGGGRG